jgi:hypothetical protein
MRFRADDSDDDDSSSSSSGKSGSAKKSTKEKEPNTRRNLDKRTARRLHSRHFKYCIKCFRHCYFGSSGRLGLAGEAKVISDSAVVTRRSAERLLAGHSTLGISVYVRKRPLFEHERAKGEYDVVSIHSDKVVGLGVVSCEL